MAYRLAGLFSTDDPVSDATQIATEQGPWDEDEFFNEGYPAGEILYAYCPRCGWEDSSICGADPVDLQQTKEILRGQHREECPGCGGELEFS